MISTAVGRSSAAFAKRAKVLKFHQLSGYFFRMTANPRLTRAQSTLVALNTPPLIPIEVHLLPGHAGIDFIRYLILRRGFSGQPLHPFANFAVPTWLQPESFGKIEVIIFWPAFNEVDPIVRPALREVKLWRSRLGLELS